MHPHEDRSLHDLGLITIIVATALTALIAWVII